MEGCRHDKHLECFDCAEARHARLHPEPVDDCFACKVGTIQISQHVKAKKAGGTPPAGNTNAWERGIAVDHRGVPLLGADLEPIGIKRYAENRRKLEAERRRLATHPDPYAMKA